MRDYVQTFEWYHDFMRRAWGTGNQQHQEIGQIYERASRTTDRTVLAQLSSQGLDLARKTDQPYWEVLFRFIQAEGHIHLKDRLPQFVELYVDINKPRYRDCPFNSRIIIALLDAYVQTDPAGYATEILDGADYVEDSLPLDERSHLVLYDIRAQVWVARRDWRRALHAAQNFADLADELMVEGAKLDAWCMMAELYYRLGAYHLVMDITLDAIPAAKAQGDAQQVMKLMHWRAAAVARMGQPEWSLDLMREIDKLAGKIGVTLETRYSRLHHAEQLGQFGMSWRECYATGEDLKTSGSYFWECEFRLRACVFLLKMSLFERALMFGVTRLRFKTWEPPESGFLLFLNRIYYILLYVIITIIGIIFSFFTRPIRTAFKEAREAAKQLKDPQPYLERLTRLEIGDFSLE